MPIKNKNDRRKRSKEHYKKNREEILEKRRKKYREDAEYRERILKSVSDRSKVCVQRRVNKAQEPLAFQIQVNEKVVEVNMYTLTQLAAALGKSVNTLRAWETRGILPKALYRGIKGTHGFRLYPEFQFHLILEAYALTIRDESKYMVDRRIASSSFPERLKEIWRKYPQGINPASV